MEQYIQPFIKTTESVFDILLKTKTVHGRTYFLEIGELDKKWDISGIIGISGDLSGAVVVSFKEETACQVTHILTGETHNSLDDFVSDTTGEIINIITGNVKKYYEDELTFKISLPSIVKGKSHCAAWPSDITRIICIPFTVFDNQEFCISVAMAKKI